MFTTFLKKKKLKIARKEKRKGKLPNYDIQNKITFYTQKKKTKMNYCAAYINEPFTTISRETKNSACFIQNIHSATQNDLQQLDLKKEKTSETKNKTLMQLEKKISIDTKIFEFVHFFFVLFTIYSTVFSFY